MLPTQDNTCHKVIRQTFTFKMRKWENRKKFLSKILPKPDQNPSRQTLNPVTPCQGLSKICGKIWIPKSLGGPTCISLWIAVLMASLLSWLSSADIPYICHFQHPVVSSTLLASLSQLPVLSSRRKLSACPPRPSEIWIEAFLAPQHLHSACP